jgi:DNA-binding MarR family transcriptional regulator
LDGSTERQLNLLALVAGQSMKELEEASGIPGGSLRRHLGRLEHSGYVERRSARSEETATDRRKVRVFRTEKGDQELARWSGSPLNALVRLQDVPSIRSYKRIKGGYLSRRERLRLEEESKMMRDMQLGELRDQPPEG